MIRIVTCPLEKFYAVLTALSEANVDRVWHVLEAKPNMDSYKNMKEGMVASHVMSDNQKIDQLLQMEPLNWWKLLEESRENKGVRPQLGAGQCLALSVSYSSLQREDVLLSRANLLPLNFYKRDPVPNVDFLSRKGLTDFL
jgi:hypothetical protein